MSRGGGRGSSTKEKSDIMVLSRGRKEGTSSGATGGADWCDRCKKEVRDEDNGLECEKCCQ